MTKILDLADVSDIFFFCLGAGEREESCEQVVGGGGVGLY